MPAKRKNRLLIRNIPVDLEARHEDPKRLTARHLGIPEDQVADVQAIRRSLDARRGRPRFVLNVQATVTTAPYPLPKGVSPLPPEKKLDPAPRVPGSPEVAIVGCGPAGLFAALRLTQAGLKPLLLDRGRDLPARRQDVSSLFTEGRLDPESNLHFGLGGAGTFSDGKLFTRLHHPGVRHILEVLTRHGAGSPDEILVDSQPHVGTDRWPAALQSLRRELESLGCRFQFKSRVTGIEARNQKLAGLKLSDGRLDCQAAILAPGNSARDLYEALDGVVGLAVKPFSVGVRMTHPQDLIDSIQYGRFKGHPALPPASYRLTAKHQGRGVYTFCMCPGGTVVPTPTEPEHLALNGMSNSARDSGQANAAVVVTVSPDDLGPPPMAGVQFQRELERAAYRAGGGDYHAPAQLFNDFISGSHSSRIPTAYYRPGITPADVATLLPDWLLTPLRQGLSTFCRRMKGLDHPDAAILGLETRTSSPVRILRGKNGMSPDAAGLFPAGEGSGYAGGIVSSAVDGIRAADNLIAWLLS
jgi:uncharacterized FAD-dependent dehydrogenase